MRRWLILPPQVGQRLFGDVSIFRRAAAMEGGPRLGLGPSSPLAFVAASSSLKPSPHSSVLAMVFVADGELVADRPYLRTVHRRVATMVRWASSASVHPAGAAGGAGGGRVAGLQQVAERRGRRRTGGTAHRLAASALRRAQCHRCLPRARRFDAIRLQLRNVKASQEPGGGALRDSSRLIGKHLWDGLWLLDDETQRPVPVGTPVDDEAVPLVYDCRCRCPPPPVARKPCDACANACRCSAWPARAARTAEAVCSGERSASLAPSTRVRPVACRADVGGLLYLHPGRQVTSVLAAISGVVHLART